MKKLIGLLSLLLALSFVWAQVASAGLINYERRNKVTGKAASSSKSAATSSPKTASRYRAASTSRYGTAQDTAAVAAQAMPAWMTVAPKATNRNERRYDVNRDGMLQPDEVKRFLATVLKRVESRGGYKINSNILTAYDRNSDGVISRSESAAIIRDTK